MNASYMYVCIFMMIIYDDKRELYIFEINPVLYY